MDTPDPQNPSSSSDPAAEGQDPSLDSGQSAGDPTKSFQSRVHQAVQGTMDRSRELVQQGRFNELDPKVAELLTAWDKTTRTPAPTSQQSSSYPDFFGRQPADDQKPAADAEAQELRQFKAAQVIADVRKEVTAELWADDVRALFAELGENEITEDDFKRVDPTNSTRFPRTVQGYLAWREEARQLRDKIFTEKYSADKGDTAVQRDKQNAQNPAVRTPTVQRSGQAVNDLHQASQLRKQGKMADDAFREMVHGVLNR